MLRLFLTKMLVTMTQHFWQQTQNCTTKKLGENVAIKFPEQLIQLLSIVWRGAVLFTFCGVALVYSK